MAAKNARRHEESESCSFLCSIVFFVAIHRFAIFKVYLLVLRQKVPQDPFIKSPADNSSQRRSENVNGEEAMAVGTGDGGSSPTGEEGEEARAEIAGGIEAGLRQRREDGNQDGDAEADKDGGHSR